MPNTGKPSQDCHLCRKRRVKCDLGKPSCQRCIKYGTECPGYRSQHELVFRSANPNRSKKRKQHASLEQSQLAVSDDDTSSLSSASTPQSSTSNALIDIHFKEDYLQGWAIDSDQLTIQRSLQEHWTSHSIPILLNVYTAVDFLHNTYVSNDTNGPLMWAAHLFSRTYITNIRYPTSVHNAAREETQRELGTYLGKALTAVSAALQDPDGAKRDDVLATVWILANYEILVGSLSRLEPLSPWHLHARGLYSILQARGVETLKTERGRAAFWPTFNMIQIQAMVTNTESPPEVTSWLDTIEQSIHEGESLALQISRFISIACHVQCLAMRALRARDFAKASRIFRDIWKELVDAETKLNDWIDGKPAFLHDLDPYMRNMQYSAIVKGYHIMQLLINFLTHYPPCPVPVEELLVHRRYCIQTVRVASQSILQNVPFAIGPLAKGKDKSPRVLFDALKLIWPLSAIYMVSTSLPEQRKQALSLLIFIGKEVGVRQALKSRPEIIMLPDESLSPLDIGLTEAIDDVPWVMMPPADMAQYLLPAD